jgi:hypothetical protein
VLLGKDLDGDGGKELLVQTKDKVVAFRAGARDVLWEQPVSGGVRAVWPATREHPATVLVGAGLGLDGRTGQPGWAGEPARAFLSTRDASDPPLALSSRGDTTVCRLPLPISPGGRFLTRSGRPKSYAAPQEDPRLVKPIRFDDIYGMEFVELTLFAVTLCLVTVIVPEILLRWALRRRRWGLTLLLTLPVIAAIVLAVFRFCRDNI